MKTGLLMVKRGRIYDYGNYAYGQRNAKRQRVSGAMSAVGLGRYAPLVPLVGAGYEAYKGTRGVFEHFGEKRRQANLRRGGKVADFQRMVDAIYAGDKKTVAHYKKKLEGSSRASKPRGGGTHQSTSTTVVPSGAIVKRSGRRRRRRRKKQSLSKRVGRLEHQNQTNWSTYRLQHIVNGRLTASTTGKSTNPWAIYAEAFTPTLIDSAWSSKLPITWTGIDTETAWSNRSFPNLPYISRSTNDTGTVGALALALEGSREINARSPFDFDAGSGNDFPVFERFGMYCAMTFYNAHAYPIHLQFNEFSPKKAVKETPWELATDVHQNTSDPTDNETFGNTKYTLPENNILRVSQVQKWYHVKTRTVEVPPGALFRYNWKTSCRRYNKDRITEAVTAAGSDTSAALPQAGTKYLAIRVWGAMGSRIAGTTAGGCNYLPTDRVEVQVKHHFDVKYKAGEGHGLHNEDFYDDRDLDQTHEVITHALEHNSSSAAT
jgi:hypothetical protein